MRAPLIAIVLSSVGGAVCAQPTDEGVKELMTCFRLARAADAICSDPKKGAAERLDCRQKASTAQLECLDRVFPGGSAGFVPPEPPQNVLPEMPTVTGSPETPNGTVTKGKPTSSQKTPPGTVPPEIPPRTVLPEMPAVTGSPGVPPRTVDISAKPQDTNWIVSETTSPVDYSPLITAVIHSTTSLQDAPNTLAIRCRGLLTELQVRTEGTWRASRVGEVQVAYQINDQPFVRLLWAVSGHGKIASYKGEVVGFLQSLPEGSRLKINVFDGPGLSHEATFQLAGLDAVREKIAVACKWAPIANKISSEKR
jgi:Type VI secretion system VasI, EvfG, VC_A0118